MFEYVSERILKYPILIVSISHSLSNRGNSHITIPLYEKLAEHARFMLKNIWGYFSFNVPAIMKIDSQREKQNCRILPQIAIKQGTVEDAL